MKALAPDYHHGINMIQVKRSLLLRYLFVLEELTRPGAMPTTGKKNRSFHFKSTLSLFTLARGSD